jgi:hypothetical protein
MPSARKNANNPAVNKTTWIACDTTITATTLTCSATRQRGARRLTARRGLQRCAREQRGGVGLLGAIVAQRAHFVPDGGDDEQDRDEGEESDGLPQPLTRHPGRQLPQFAGEEHHHGQHHQRQRAAHQRAERTHLLQRKPERPQQNRAKAEVRQPDCQQRHDRETERLGGGDAGKPAVCERKPENEQRHHQQRRGATARLAERGASLSQQVQRERRRHQQQRQHTQPDHITEIGIAIGEFGQQHGHRDHRTDPADHRRRALDQGT